MRTASATSAARPTTAARASIAPRRRTSSDAVEPTTVVSAAMQSTGAASWASARRRGSSARSTATPAPAAASTPASCNAPVTGLGPSDVLHRERVLLDVEEVRVGLYYALGFVLQPQLALVDPQRLVAQLLDRAERVADQQDGAVLPAQLAHLLERLALEARVADRQRFVDQEDVRVHVDRHREREPPVHARRVRLHRHVHELLELGELDDLVVLLLE